MNPLRERVVRLVPSLTVVLLVAGCATGPAPSAARDSKQDDLRRTVSQVTTTPEPEPEPRELGTFSRRRAMAHVRKLARDIGVRVRATRGERRGARYIARKFKALGYKVFVQKFSVDGRTSRNVIARWPGAQRYPVIIGGHMDSVPGSPGANDNASGVAVVLEIARLARDTEQADLLKFVAFGSEEYGTNGEHHVGSQVYVDRLGNRGRRRLGGMISVDMVADGRPLLVGTSGIGPEVLARILFRRIDRAGIAVERLTTCDCSDNGPFERAGIPASFMWSGSESNYHDPSDTVANMELGDLKRSGRAVLQFVKALDKAMLERLREY